MAKGNEWYRKCHITKKSSGRKKQLRLFDR